MRFPSFSGLADGFSTAFRRFPLPMLVSIAGSILMIIYLEMERTYPSDDIQWIPRAALTCLFALPLLTGLTLLGEAQNWPNNRRWLALGGGVVAALGVYWMLYEGRDFDDITVPRMFGLLLVAHLFVSFAAYLNARSVADFWTFNNLIFGRLVVGGCFTMLLWVGLSGALLAVDQLFNLDISERSYPQLFLALAGIFNTTYFLFHVPERFDFDADEIDENAFRVLVKFILIPLSLLYFVILYAYGAKIGLQWDLPKGWVSSLVIGFAAVGVFTWLLNFLIARRDGVMPFGPFARWSWWIMVPLTVLLFVAVGRRIADYGVTPSRFTVAHVGVWLVVCAAYFIFSKKDNIKFVPISLAGFALVALFGPLSMFSVSERSQLRILQNILERHGAWADGQARPATNADFTTDESSQISSILSFLTRQRDFVSAKPDWLAAMPDSILQSRDADSYLLPSDIGQWIGAGSAPDFDPTKNYVLNKIERATHVNIPAGYTEMYNLDSHVDNLTVPDRESYFFTLDSTGKYLVFKKLNEKQQAVELDRYALESLLTQLEKAHPYNLSTSELFLLSGSRTRVAIHLDRIEFERKKEGLAARYFVGLILLEP
jgi:Domain of unknown function (DUF4153)